MNLVVDIGNSSINIGLFEIGKLKESKRVQEDELGVLLSQTWEGIIVSCVGALPKLDFSKAHVFNSTTKLPIQLNYKTIETLGQDRIAAAVGARVLFPDNNCLVIDLGTCINYELVTANDVYEGGVISPGYAMRLQTMHNFTIGLPLLPTVNEIKSTGKSTKECMQSGAFNGVIHEIEGFIAHYESQIKDLKVLICGGDLKTFESKLKPTIFAQPNLVLIGLNRILEIQNAK